MEQGRAAILPSWTVFDRRPVSRFFEYVYDKLFLVLIPNAGVWEPFLLLLRSLFVSECYKVCLSVLLPTSFASRQIE